MHERNDGKGKSNVTQNQFTAYLISALRRRKAQYQRQKTWLTQFESSLDIHDYNFELNPSLDFADDLPFIEQIDNVKLFQSLKRAHKRELRILLAKTLDDRSLTEIASELGLRYNTVASVYYRVLKKLRKEMEDDTNGLS